jgi:hypothetical protein
MDSSNWYYYSFGRCDWGQLVMPVINIKNNNPSLPPVIKIKGKTFKVNK